MIASFWGDVWHVVEFVWVLGVAIVVLWAVVGGSGIRVKPVILLGGGGNRRRRRRGSGGGA